MEAIAREKASTIRKFVAANGDLSEEENGLVDYLATLDAFASVAGRGTREHRSYAEMLLAHGSFYPAGPLPDDVSKGQKKQCFGNAANLALDNPTLMYVEGYATAFIPVEHAWCVDVATGMVVDPTWPEAEANGATYFGIPYTDSFLRDHLLETGVYGTLSSDWKLSHRAIVQGYVYDSSGMAYGWGDRL